MDLKSILETGATFIEDLLGAGQVPAEKTQPAQDTASTLRSAAQTLGDDAVSVGGDVAAKLFPLIAPFLPALEGFIDGEIAKLTAAKQAVAEAKAAAPQATMAPVPNPA